MLKKKLLGKFQIKHHRQKTKTHVPIASFDSDQLRASFVWPPPCPPLLGCLGAEPQEDFGSGTDCLCTVS